MSRLTVKTQGFGARFLLAALFAMPYLSGCGEAEQSAKDEPAQVQLAESGQLSSDVGAPANYDASLIDYAGASLTDAGGYALGDPNAPVKVIEYASLTCSHCARFHSDTFPKLKEKYIATGQVYYEFRNFVLNGPDLAAAMVTRCTGDSRYFALTDLFFTQQPKWLTQDPLSDLRQLAKRAGISEARFNTCIQGQEAREAVVKLRDAGVKEFDVNATPTIIVDGNKIERGQFWPDLDETISARLAS